jgi:hypothetical protein
MINYLSQNKEHNIAKAETQLKCAATILEPHNLVLPFFYYSYWGETEPTWYCGHCMAYCTSCRR